MHDILGFRCDQCVPAGKLTAWLPSCRSCGEHVCPTHTEPGSEREEGRRLKSGDVVMDYDVTTVECLDCAAWERSCPSPDMMGAFNFQVR